MASTKGTVKAIRSDGERSRQTILLAAAKLATLDGLDGISIGALAEHIGMSKSGLYAHFGSKEELQLATIETAFTIFDAEVLTPASSVADPLDRIDSLFGNFLLHLENRVFPGGCFFAAAAAEFDTHPGPIKQRVLELHESWLELIADLIRSAQESSAINREEDPAQITFELDAFLLMANGEFVLKNDSRALERARRAIRRRIDAARAEPIPAR